MKLPSSALLQAKAEKLGSLFPPLQIEAERVAATVWQGVHGRRRAGAGDAFWQFRRYQPGDGIQNIDWRQSARGDHVFIREREWEAVQTAYLWADSSGSMQYSSSKNTSTKVERARLLLLALASLLLRGGEKVCWLDTKNPVVTHGRRGLEEIVERLSSVPGASLPPAVPLARSAHMVLCSDFLTDPEALTAVIKNAVAAHIKGVLLHLYDPAELELPFKGRIELFGLENESPLMLSNARSLSEAYRKRVAEHQDHLKTLCRGSGFSYVQHLTTDLPHLVLINIFQYLSSL